MQKITDSITLVIIPSQVFRNSDNDQYPLLECPLPNNGNPDLLKHFLPTKSENDLIVVYIRAKYF